VIAVAVRRGPSNVRRAERKPGCGTRAAATGCSALLCASLVLSLLATACSRADHDLKRPFEENGDFAVEYGQVGNVTRPFVRFGSGDAGAAEIALGPVRRGFLRTHLALDSGGDGATAVLELSGESALSMLLGDETSACRQQWAPAEKQREWKTCQLPIRRDHRDATLRIRLEGPDGARLRVASPILVAADAPPRSDAFVIVVDTARADAFTTYNQRVPIGEQLAALAEDSVVFDELRAPSSWTRASVATLLTGLPQRRHQVFGRLHPLSSDLTTLQSHFRKNGYVTLAWSTNPNILPVWGFANEFDRFEDAGVRDWFGDKTDASVVFELVRAGVEANRGLPALYYIHLMDPHSPYRPPEADFREVRELARRQPGIFPAPVLATRHGAGVAMEYQRYLAEIRDFDARMGEFIDFLEQIGRYEDALILVVSDHGEEFLDHGGLFHGRNLYEESLRVPGFLKLPGNERAGTRIEQAVALADLLPTITNRLGLAPLPGIEGIDALGPRDPELPQIAQLNLDEQRMAAVKFDGWKLIVDYITGGVELYNLLDDPNEKMNLSDERREKVAELRELLDRMAALHAEGWHLRGCGCEKTSSLRLQIHAAGSEAVGSEFEERDAVTPLAGGKGFAVTFDLTPKLRRQERFGREIKHFFRDEDEIALRRADSGAADAPVRIRPAAAGGLRYALGNGGLRHLDGWLDLNTVVDASELAVGEPADCTPPAPAPARPSKGKKAVCQPYVRIWHVAPPRAVSESTIDPSVSERLKALGYTW